MKLTLNRRIYTVRSTIGELEINGRKQCFILEDPVRPEKIKGQTAIPAGQYRIIISWSPRFQVDMPLLENVPNYEGVRIHPGNTPNHTEGCLLPGKTMATDFVGSSRVAYKALFAKIKKALSTGEDVVIDIVETGKSPWALKTDPEDAEKSEIAVAGGVFRILADPLRIRSSARTDIQSNIIGRLPMGTLVTGTGQKTKAGWVHVTTNLEGKELTGHISAEYAEAVIASPDVKPAVPVAVAKIVSKDVYRVAVNALNFRSEAGNMEDKAIIATLPKGHLVTKTRDWRKAMWWEVETVIHGESKRGFVFSSMVTPVSGDGEEKSEATAPTAESGGVVVSEKALQLILEFEGMDQPGKWPGEKSGITLGHGYDLGYHTHDQLMGDWGPHLSADVLQRLARALGKTGLAAKNMASRFSDIKIPLKAADAVFAQSTIPRIRASALVAFPGITSLPPDAQGALGSLVYNRGTSMKGDRRSEMREVRDFVRDSTLSMPEKLRSIAASIRSMKRLWPDTRGLRRRRDAEADLIESCV